MDFEVTVIVKKTLCVEGPKDIETAIELVRKIVEADGLALSTFQKWKAGTATSNPMPCEELIHIVDMRPIECPDQASQQD